MQKSIRARSCRLATVRCSYRQSQPCNSISRSQGFPAALLEVESGAARCQRPPFCIRSASCGHPGWRSGGISFSVALLLASRCGVRWPAESVTGRHQNRPVYLRPSVSGRVLLHRSKTRSKVPGRQSTSPPDLPLEAREMCRKKNRQRPCVRLGLVPETQRCAAT